MGSLRVNMYANDIHAPNFFVHYCFALLDHGHGKMLNEYMFKVQTKKNSHQLPKNREEANKKRLKDMQKQRFEIFVWIQYMKKIGLEKETCYTWFMMSPIDSMMNEFILFAMHMDHD